MNLGAAILRNSVRPRTGRTYSTAARRWFTVAEKIGTNPTMTVIPDAWNHRHDDLADSSITWPEACMVVYLVTSTQPGYENSSSGKGLTQSSWTTPNTCAIQNKG